MIVNFFPPRRPCYCYQLLLTNYITVKLFYQFQLRKKTTTKRGQGVVTCVINRRSIERSIEREPINLDEPNKTIRRRYPDIRYSETICTLKQLLPNVARIITKMLSGLSSSRFSIGIFSHSEGKLGL